MDEFVKYVREVIDKMTLEEFRAMQKEFDDRIDTNSNSDGMLVTAKALEEFNLIIIDEE
jgi:hypothetical protein